MLYLFFRGVFVLHSHVVDRSLFRRMFVKITDLLLSLHLLLKTGSLKHPQRNILSLYIFSFTIEEMRFQDIGLLEIRQA